MFATAVVLDTNVLACAVGGDHALRTPARAVVTAVTEGRLRATTTPQVIQEFAYVMARRRDRDAAARSARDFARLLHPLLIGDHDDLDTGLRWWSDTPTLGSFDAVLAATAARLAPNRPLITADRALLSTAFVPTIALDDPELVQSLSGP